MPRYLLKKAEIDAMPGLAKQHFLNPDAQRVNKSLGDLCGLTGMGFHLIEVPPGKCSTEYHVHYDEDECTYVLSGTGTVEIGDETHQIGPGDFIGYPAGGLPHTMHNTGSEPLRCLVAGTRLAHDVGDYPRLGKRIFRRAGQPANVVDHAHIATPEVGRKT
ncbi:MAG: cupin domain-containing protein [Burkholderiaceae bacterium]